MVCQTAKYQAVNSPSKIDQWRKPKPAAKLVLALVRRSPLMLKEGAGGSMKGSLDMAQRVSIGTLSYSPFIPLYLRGGAVTQQFNYYYHCDKKTK